MTDDDVLDELELTELGELDDETDDKLDELLLIELSELSDDELEFTDDGDELDELSSSVK